MRLRCLLATVFRSDFRRQKTRLVQKILFRYAFPDELPCSLYLRLELVRVF